MDDVYLNYMHKPIVKAQKNLCLLENFTCPIMHFQEKFAYLKATSVFSYFHTDDNSIEALSRAKRSNCEILAS